MGETDETADERATRLMLEDLVGLIARGIKESLPSGVGFALLLFDFGPKGSFSYAATGNREDVVRLLGEARDKIRGERLICEG